ncbi:hypothetical protein BH11ARM2_BH11ARM2_27340 [soil metagenome]
MTWSLGLGLFIVSNGETRLLPLVEFARATDPAVADWLATVIPGPAVPGGPLPPIPSGVGEGDGWRLWLFAGMQEWNASEPPPGKPPLAVQIFGARIHNALPERGVPELLRKEHPVLCLGWECYAFLVADLPYRAADLTNWAGQVEEKRAEWAWVEDPFGGWGVPLVGSLSNVRGVALSNLNRPAEAEVAYRECVAIRRPLSEEEPRYLPDLAMVLNNLGTALVSLNRPAEAETTYGKVIAISLGQTFTELDHMAEHRRTALRGKLTVELRADAPKPPEATFEEVEAINSTSVWGTLLRYRGLSPDGTRDLHLSSLRVESERSEQWLAQHDVKHPDYRHFADKHRQTNEAWHRLYVTAGGTA